MMTDKVRVTLSRYSMLSDGCHVTVALSGGADSTALLHILHTMRVSPAPGETVFTLSAAHLHHGIRGEEADRDETFVRALCQKWDIPLRVEHADIPALCRQSGEGLEECARRVRYDFLQRCARGGIIATAHTATDNTETVLMHLLRGSALRGLCGIPPVRDNIVRPLLDCSREEVEEYCGQMGLCYVTDSTNQTDDCLRNRIRHHLLPMLEELEPGMSGRIGRMIERLRQDEECLSSQAQQIYTVLRTAEADDTKLSAQALLALSPALRSRVLMAYAASLTTGRMESRHIDALEELLVHGGAVTLPGGVCIACKDGILRPGVEASFLPAQHWKKPLTTGFLSLPTGRYRCSSIPLEDRGQKEKIYKLLLNRSIDYDKIWGKAFVRTRLPGDSITLPGRPRKSLKKLFNEAHLPLEQRASCLIVEDEGGLVFIEGFGCDERCAPDRETKRLLCIEKLEDTNA